MRTQLELLKILKSVYLSDNGLQRAGLCFAASMSCCKGIISTKERRVIDKIVEKYLKRRKILHDGFGYKVIVNNTHSKVDIEDCYGWKVGEVEPRIKWLDSQIKKRTKK